jgi:beta-lactamase regulating signal transducer with metallopeptidase domain
MFAFRGFAVSLSIFFIVYSALSVVVWLAWRGLWRYIQPGSARRCADLLFALRMLPLIAATGMTLAFAVPSFLLLEPRTMEESMGGIPVLLGLCGMAVMLGGAWNAVTALARASQAVLRWSTQARMIGSRPINSRQSVSVLQTTAAAPPLTAAGILQPTVWLSCAAEFVLTERELSSALRHEVVHVRRRDNLRKLFLRLVPFPGMAQLEAAWREATEMAADDAAVSSASEALDLAAAVIKLSRLAPMDLPAELTTALVHSPAQSVNARVERLIAWTKPMRNPAEKYWLGYTLCATLAVCATMAVTYSELLVRVHAATEWLVR